MSNFSLGCPTTDVTTRLIAAVFLNPLDPNLVVDEKPSLSFQLSGSSVIQNDLPSALKTLSETCNVLGNSEEDKQEGFQWIAKLKALTADPNPDLKDLEDHLRSRTFMVGKSLSAVDLVVYTSLYPHIKAATHQDLLKHPSVTRHFDFIQNASTVRTAMESNESVKLPLVAINLDDVPEVERKAIATEKKEKKLKANATEATGQAGALKVSPESVSGTAGDKAAKSEKKKGEQDKEKKEKKKAGGGDAKKPAAAADGPPMPHMIDMRIGKIIHVEKHPDADSLYVEKIDFGEPEPRTVVSGLVNYIPIEEMRDRLLVGICNLKPANMRGVKSFAMVLAATSKDGKGGAGSVELVAPPPGSQPGDRVYFEGFEAETPIEQLNPKKKQFETIQPNFTTLDTKEACWTDPSNNGKPHRIMTERGVCCAPTFIGATLS